MAQITAQQIATADVAALQAALQASENQDAATQAAINAAITALNTPPVQQQAPVAMPYDARTRIPLTSNILPNGITLVAVGATGTPTTAQAAAQMVPIMVQLKVGGQLRWTAATIMNNVQPIAANLTLTVSSYINKQNVPAYSLDASFGGRQQAVRVSIDQLREEVEYAKLQAELATATASQVNTSVSTQILMSELEIKTAQAKVAKAQAAAI